MFPPNSFALELLESRRVFSAFFTIQDFGSLGESFNPIAINDEGQAVGSLPLSEGTAPGTGCTPTLSELALWSPSSGFQRLPTLQGAENVAVNDFNSRGEIVGHMQLGDAAAGEDYLQLFLYTDGTLRPLENPGSSPNQFYNLYANIDDSGRIIVTGNLQQNRLSREVFLADTGRYIDLGILPPARTFDQFDFDEDGQLIVTTRDSSGGADVYLSADGEFEEVGTFDDAGITARYQLLHSQHDAALISNGIIVRNGDHVTEFSLPDNSVKLERLIQNDRGRVIVTATRGENQDLAVFILDGTVLRDIDSLIPPGTDLSLEDAYDMNSAGQIIASMSHHGGGDSFPFNALLNPILGASFPDNPGPTDVQLTKTRDYSLNNNSEDTDSTSNDSEDVSARTLRKSEGVVVGDKSQIEEGATEKLVIIPVNSADSANTQSVAIDAQSDDLFSLRDSLSLASASELLA